MSISVAQEFIIAGGFLLPREGKTYNRMGDEIRSGNVMSKRITKIRQPKKLAQKKGAKVAASLDKMYSDGAHAASVIETNEWERDNSVRVAQGLEPFTFKKWKNKKSTRENRRNSRGK